MTKNYFEKKNIRQYADEHGLNYTQAMSALNEPLDGRPGLDDIRSEIVRHAQIDMMEREDGRGYRNGSLTADVLRTWIPVLERTDSDKWKLANYGPAENHLWLIAEGFVPAGEPFYPTVETAQWTDETGATDDMTGGITQKFDDLAGLTFFVYPHIVSYDFDMHVNDAKARPLLAEQKIGQRSNVWFVHEDGAQDSWQVHIKRDENFADNVVDVMNALSAAMAGIAHDYDEDEYEDDSADALIFADMVASYDPLLARAGAGWTMDMHEKSADAQITLSLGEIGQHTVMRAGHFVDDEPNSDRASEITEHFADIAGLSFSIERWLAEDEHVDFDGLLETLTQIEDNFVNEESVTFERVDGVAGVDIWMAHVTRSEDFVDVATRLMSTIAGAVTDCFEVDEHELVYMSAGGGGRAGGKPAGGKPSGAGGLDFSGGAGRSAGGGGAVRGAGRKKKKR